MAEGTDAARARVLAARGEFDAELARLEASARAAVDIPGKIRRKPAQAAAVAGGVGFVAIGGPKRLFRRVKTTILGPEQVRPKTLLPKEVDKTLSKMGTDGDAIRAVLERDFRDYVEKQQKKRGPADAATAAAAAFAGPVFRRLGRQAAEWLANPDNVAVQEQLARIRERERARSSGSDGEGPGSSA